MSRFDLARTHQDKTDKSMKIHKWGWLNRLLSIFDTSNPVPGLMKLNESCMEQMEAAMRDTGTDNEDFVNSAITLFMLAIDQKRKGRRIGSFSYDKDGEIDCDSVQEVQLDALDNVRTIE